MGISVGSLLVSGNVRIEDHYIDLLQGQRTTITLTATTQTKYTIQQGTRREKGKLPTNGSINFEVYGSQGVVEIRSGDEHLNLYPGNLDNMNMRRGRGNI